MSVLVLLSLLLVIKGSLGCVKLLVLIYVQIASR